MQPWLFCHFCKDPKWPSNFGGLQMVTVHLTHILAFIIFVYPRIQVILQTCNASIHHDYIFFFENKGPLRITPPFGVPNICTHLSIHGFFNFLET
jgi:hypothetical protein